MAKKVSKEKGRADSPGRNEVERLLSRGRLREAVKAARRAYSRNSTPANSRILQKALLSRISMLEYEQRNSSCPPLVEELLQLVPRDPELQPRVVSVLVRLGMVQRARELVESLESEVREGASAVFEAELADAAVRDPSVVPGSLAQFYEQAKTVRSALERIEAGDDATVSELLASIPRRSPFAPWRLFARGLTAFYNGDASTAQENWDRIEDHRLPGRVARRLAAVGELGDDWYGTPPAVALEQVLERPPLVAGLLKLRQALNQADWHTASKSIGQLNGLCRAPEDMPWRQRITEAVYPKLLDQAAEAPSRAGRLPGAMEKLLKALEPLAIDPTWDRFRALALERRAAEGETKAMKEAQKAWRRYERQIEQHGLFGDHQRLARSLVLGRLADMTVHAAQESDQMPWLMNMISISNEHEQQSRTERMLGEALALARESVELCPEHIPNHERLAEIASICEDEAILIEAYERLIEYAPDNTKAHQRLFSLHMQRGDPEKMLQQARRLRELNPLDELAQKLLYHAHVALARHEAIAGRTDSALANFAEAETHKPDIVENPEHLIKKAFIEQKAGRDEQASTLLAESQARHEEEGAWHLLAYVETLRWQLPESWRKRHLTQWKRALRGRTSAKRAAAISDILVSYLMVPFAYPERNEHLLLVLDYLRRSAKTGRYNRQQMSRVCIFLNFLLSWCQMKDVAPRIKHEAIATAERLCEKGVFRFDDLAECHWLAVKSQLAAAGDGAIGPMNVSFLHISFHLHKTIELTEGAQDPSIQEIREEAEMLYRHLDLPMDPSGGFGGGLGELAQMIGGDPEELMSGLLEDMIMLEDHEDDFDDFEDFGDFDDQPDLFGYPEPGPAPQPQKKKRQGSRKRRRRR